MRVDGPIKRDDLSKRWIDWQAIAVQKAVYMLPALVIIHCLPPLPWAMATPESETIRIWKCDMHYRKSQTRSPTVVITPSPFHEGYFGWGWDSPSEMIYSENGCTSAFASLDSGDQVLHVGISIHMNAHGSKLQSKIVDRLKSLDSGSACRFGCCSSERDWSNTEDFSAFFLDDPLRPAPYADSTISTRS